MRLDDVAVRVVPVLEDEVCVLVVSVTVRVVKVCVAVVSVAEVVLVVIVAEVVEMPMVVVLVLEVSVFVLLVLVEFQAAPIRPDVASCIVYRALTSDECSLYVASLLIHLQLLSPDRDQMNLDPPSDCASACMAQAVESSAPMLEPQQRP